MAAVRIENDAWGDPRYMKLARLCGLVDPRFALILCGAVWSHCTDNKTYVVDGRMIDTIAGIDGFAEHMATAQLAERQKKGFRIKGSKGRIEWLEKLKESASKGGKQKAANRLALASQKPSKPVADAKQTAAKPVPSYSSSSSVSSSEEEDRVLRAREQGGEGRPRSTHPTGHLALWEIWEDVNGGSMGSPASFERELVAILAVAEDRAPKKKTTVAALFREHAGAHVLEQRAKKERVNLVWLSKAFASLCDAEPAQAGKSKRLASHAEHAAIAAAEVTPKFMGGSR